MQFDQLSHSVIACALEVHTQLGAGLMESCYESCFCHELAIRNIKYQRQVVLPIEYKNVQVKNGYRVDLLIENKLIIELKSVEKILPIHARQLLTYMKLAKIKTGLLINFNVYHLKQGIRRFVL